MLFLTYITRIINATENFVPLNKFVWLFRMLFLEALLVQDLMLFNMGELQCSILMLI